MSGSGLVLALLGCRQPDPCAEGEPAEVDALLETSPWCAGWIDGARGRVGRGILGSFVVWSRRTLRRQALIASAMHPLGLDWFDGEPGVALPERLAPPEDGRLWLWLPPADGATGVREGMGALYDLYHVDVPAEDAWSPRHDAFVGVIDRALDLRQDWLAPIDGPPEPGLVPLYDPLGATLEQPTWAEAVPGTDALLIGYPHRGERDDDPQQFSIGVILGDDEAGALVGESSAESGSAELPYDPEVEMVIRAGVESGMSGGGVFDGEGRWIGTIVRSMTASDGPAHARAVRASYLVARIEAALGALPERERASVTPYLEDP